MTHFQINENNIIGCVHYFKVTPGKGGAEYKY